MQQHNHSVTYTHTHSIIYEHIHTVVSFKIYPYNIKKIELLYVGPEKGLKFASPNVEVKHYNWKIVRDSSIVLI